MGLLLLGGLFWMMVWGGFSVYVAGQKGRSVNEGMVFGALLGPIGLLVLAMLPPASQTREPVKVVYEWRPRKMLGEVTENRSLKTP